MKRILITFLLFLPILSFGQVNLKNGLVACYPFNASAVDATGNGNDGTVNGATLTTDRFGIINSAYNFDGNSYISIIPDQFKNKEFTYAIWVNIDDLPVEGDNSSFFSVGGPGADQQLSITNKYFNVSNNGFSCGGYNSSNPVVSNNWAGTFPNLNKWYHLVATRDKISFKLYVDGVLIADNSQNSATNGTDAIYANPSNAVMGARVGQNGFFQTLKGSLDDIYIYNRPLSPEEVTALFQTTKSIPCENGVIACHPFLVVKTK